MFKIALVGDSGVGKSSIVLRLAEDRFTISSCTVGYDFKKCVVYSTLGYKTELTLCDTAGDERFNTCILSCCRKAHGVILVYDLTCKKSFMNIERVWLDQVRENCDDRTVLILIGHKIDSENTEVTTQEGRDLARKHGMLFAECSSKTGDGVVIAIRALLDSLLNTWSKDYYKPTIVLQSRRPAVWTCGC